MTKLAKLTCWFFIFLISAFESGAAQKPKLIVETDIGGDKDDQGTFCRLLLYSNNFDIKAIICDRPSSKMNLDGSRWYPSGANTTDGVALAESYIDRWGSVRSNLILHDSTYPTVTYLKDVTVAGWDSTSAGVDKIILEVDAIPAGSVIWYGNWGSNTGTVSNLKRAFDKVKNLRGQAGLESFIAKIRICTLDGATNTKQGYNAEVRAKSMHIETGYPDMSGRWYHMFQTITATAGGFSLSSDVLNGHGQLGLWYPGQKEGDSWTIVHLLPLGISDPLKPWWGGAAGRYAARNGGDASVIGAPFYWNNQQDTWNGSTNRNNTAARFAAALQNDFRARWDWCVLSFANANHPPVAKLTAGGTTVTTDVLEISASAGGVIAPSSSPSTDPDSGDSLSHAWTYYREAGTYSGSVSIANSNSASPTITVPTDAAGKQLHFYVEVRDNGSRKGNRIPDLSRFCRLVVNVSGATENPPPTVSITSPGDGEAFTPGSNITIDATASDSNGTITRVDFYQGSTLLNSDSSSPYSFTWNSVAAGNYSLTAKAFDNGGAVTTSDPVNITVSTGGGSVLFSDDFNDGNANGWTADASGWTVVNSEYRFVGGGTAKYSTAGDIAWQNYVLSARVKLANNNSHRTGLMVYGQSQSNGYRVEFAPASSYNVTAYLMEGSVQIASANLSMSFQTYQNVSIDVIPEGTGVRIVLFVNGVQKLNHLDATPSFTSGKIGVYGGSWATGYVDDLVVEGVGGSGGTTLVSDDFNDGNANGWTADASGWTVVSGEYKFVGAGAAKYSTIGDTAWQDYALGARVKLTANNYHRIGLMVYGQSQNNGYRIEFAPDNNHNVTAYLMEGSTQIASANLSMSFQTYRDVSIDVVPEGGSVRIVLFVDDVQKLNHLDTTPSFTAGKIGVCGGSWAVGYVDDIIVVQ